MKQALSSFILSLSMLICSAQPETALGYAEDLFYNYRMNYDYAEYKDSLASMSFEKLVADLDTDSKKETFWLNIYNVYAQIHLENNAQDYANKFKFFNDKFIVIAGETFSLNQIEHGILRHSKVWWGRGAIPKIFVKKREKQLRVEQLDARIHFALNCGAKSCPPILYYELMNLDKQLDIASAGFLEQNVSVDTALNVVTVSKIMSWYRKDFGGKKGIVKWLKHYQIIPVDSNPKVNFASYDWSPSPRLYTE